MGYHKGRLLNLVSEVVAEWDVLGRQCLQANAMIVMVGGNDITRDSTKVLATASNTILIIQRLVSCEVI